MTLPDWWSWNKKKIEPAAAQGPPVKTYTIGDLRIRQRDFSEFVVEFFFGSNFHPVAAVDTREAMVELRCRESVGRTFPDFEQAMSFYEKVDKTYWDAVAVEERRLGEYLNVFEPPLFEKQSLRPEGDLRAQAIRNVKVAF